jgi:hypothetical protein
MHLSLPTIVVLLLSIANLGLLSLAMFGKAANGERSDESGRILRKISVSASTAGQLLYLIMAAAWLLRWTRFYPGAPLPTYTTYVGMTLSLVALFAGYFGHGPRRWATILAAITLAGLWLLAAMASVAV